MKLSPTTCYYIRKLLLQPPSGVGTAATKTSAPPDALSNLDEVLQSLYPSASDVSRVIQQLENLVYLHEKLYPQTRLYADYANELTKVEQQIFRLLGCQSVGV